MHIKNTIYMKKQYQARLSKTLFTCSTMLSILS